MNSTVDIPGMQQVDAETFDVIVIGAGLSGVGTAEHKHNSTCDRGLRNAMLSQGEMSQHPSQRHKVAE